MARTKQLPPCQHKPCQHLFSRHYMFMSILLHLFQYGIDLEMTLVTILIAGECVYCSE